MTRRHDTQPFETIRLEGALFVPDLLERASNCTTNTAELFRSPLPNGKSSL
jgi:hypothetical protein